MRTTGEAFAETVGGFIALVLILLTATLFITLPWDLLVWLTGNEDSWRHTGFMAPLAAFVGIVVIRLLCAAVDGFFALVGAGTKALSRSWAAKPRAVKEAPPACPQERYKWSNRLPPYDQ
ncbi:MAG: hypothetical protein ACXIU8_14020 [Alkalilacustris sp.]